VRQLDTSTALVLVISDGVAEIRNAVRQMWPRAAGTPVTGLVGTSRIVRAQVLFAEAGCTSTLPS